MINYREPHACERCGAWIEHPNPRGKPQRFCSRTCKAGTRQMRTYICQTCSVQWTTESREGQPPRYCSEKCRKDAATARARAWYYANPERATEHKATSNINYYAANRNELIAKTAQYAKDNPDKVGAWHSARYARTRGSLEAELFTLDEIYARDRGVCYLCHLECPRNRASMDHVVPTCAPHHGPHTRANVKLAHRSCNGRKGRKLLSELSWYVPMT